MKLFNLSLSNMMLRYYLMMAVVVAGGFTGQWWLAFLALPLFLSCLLGVSFTTTGSSQQVATEAARHKIATEEVEREVKSAA